MGMCEWANVMFVVLVLTWWFTDVVAIMCEIDFGQDAENLDENCID